MKNTTIEEIMEITTIEEIMEIIEDINLGLGYEKYMIEEFLEEIEDSEELAYEVLGSFIEAYTSWLFIIYSKELGLIEYVNKALENRANSIEDALRMGIKKYNKELLQKLINWFLI